MSREDNLEALFIAAVELASEAESDEEAQRIMKHVHEVINTNDAGEKQLPCSSIMVRHAGFEGWLKKCMEGPNKGKPGRCPGPQKAKPAPKAKQPKPDIKQKAEEAKQAYSSKNRQAINNVIADVKESSKKLTGLGLKGLKAIATTLGMEGIYKLKKEDLSKGICAFLLGDSYASKKKFTGQKTDSRGAKICYMEGKRVPCKNFEELKNGTGQSAGKLDAGANERVGEAVAAKTPGASNKNPDQERQSEGKPTDSGTTQRVPARVETVNKKLDRYGKYFKSKGLHEAANWMDLLRGHINSVGVEAALESLGPEKIGEGEEVQYGGHNLDGKHDADFIEKYLSRAGIMLISGTVPTGNKRAISSENARKETDESGVFSRNAPEDYFPTTPTMKDKLDEAQHLPGLSKSEDLGRLMGQRMGDRIDSFNPDVIKRLDDTYGEGQWVVKPYGNEAYAGYGIYFPQKVKRQVEEAKNNMWASGTKLNEYGFEHIRDKNGKCIGVKGGGEEYLFGKVFYDFDENSKSRLNIEGNPKYNTLYGEVRQAADQAAIASLDEQSVTVLPGKFMAQPAFPAVGISDEERAQGITFKKGLESRVHIVTRNGKAELVPHSTWLKGEKGKEDPLPVVFENDDTRAMAQAALDAINHLPESERQGQIYAPDIMRTAQGFKVVEANPSNESGASGYLGDNQFIMDAYVSQLTGREPAHVQFIRDLLSKRMKNERKDATGKDRGSGRESGKGGIGKNLKKDRK